MAHDLRYALRTLRRSPVFAISAILALALGVGANTAVFSVIYAVLLKPLPYAEPDRLLQLSEVNAVEGRGDGRVSRGTFLDWRARLRTLEGLAAYSSSGETLWAAGERYMPVRSAAVSADLFRVLGATPLLGRAFKDGDQGKIVLSYELWQRWFGGAADVVGRGVTVEGRFTGEIIGVMPRGFAFPDGTEAWVNLHLSGSIAPAARRNLSYRSVARLASGVSLQDARSELVLTSAQLAVEQPASNAGWSAVAEPLSRALAPANRRALIALAAAVASILLLGCANVANLLLARGTRRREELAIRAALGAGTPRLVRHCVTEAVVLAACGAAAGLLVGNWLTAVFIRLAPPEPRLADAGMNGRVLTFALALSLLTTVLVAMAPAFEARHVSAGAALRSGTRGATDRSARVRRALIAGEVALVLVLLTGALLLLRTFVGLSGVDLGFEPVHAWSVSTRWPVGRMVASTPGTRPWPRLQRAVDGLIDAVAAIPGVEAVGLVSDVPLTGNPYSGTLWRTDAIGASGLTPPPDPRDRWKADLSVVTPGYFTALGVPFLRGRNFTDTDRWTDDQLNDTTAPAGGAVIVNSAFAARYLPDQDPVGRELVLYDDQTFGWLRRIVGVVADVRGHAVSEAPVPMVYVPHAQHPDVFLPSLIVRSSLPSGAIAAALRDRINSYDSQLLVQRIRRMDEVVSGALSRPRFNVLLVGSFAVLGLILAAIGIYGVVSFLVTQRTREIGIRMSLGARPADVLRLVLREGLSPVLAGGITGLAAAVAATRALRTVLYGVTPLDAVSFASAPAILAAVALVACYLPARRAAAVDPLVALREE